MSTIARGFFKDLFKSKGGIGEMDHILSRVDRCITE